MEQSSRMFISEFVAKNQLAREIGVNLYRLNIMIGEGVIPAPTHREKTVKPKYTMREALEIVENYRSK